MELIDLLEQHSNTVYNKHVNSKIHIHFSQDIIDITNKKPHAILLGYKENRNSTIASTLQIADEFRVSLEKLCATSESLTIVDIGNCKQGKTVRESYIILQEVLKILKELQIPIIIIGGTQESLYYIGKEILKKVQYPTICCIDSKIDLDIDSEDFSNTNYISKLVNLSETQRLISIAYQEYLSIQKTYEWFKSQYFPLVRLGKVRQNILEVEPLIRDSQIVSFDMSAIRYSDMPSQIYSNPNGLYAEESCQLAWYAGYSPNIRVFCLHDTFFNESTKVLTATLTAQIIWHFLDGISQQKQKKCDFSAEKFTKYYVQNSFLEQDITFFENIYTKQMWVEIPLKNKKKKRILPCSSLDYQVFLDNNLSENWLLEFNRLYNK
ncbi:MAG TPA: hypothetical protein PLS12_00315 [Bacteroidales bacterium]|nr:hypothetical protein [Bacteroidales bacterium]